MMEVSQLYRKWSLKVGDGTGQHAGVGHDSLGASYYQMQNGHHVQNDFHSPHEGTQISTFTDQTMKGLAFKKHPSSMTKGCTGTSCWGHHSQSDSAVTILSSQSHMRTMEDGKNAIGVTGRTNGQSVVTKEAPGSPEMLEEFEWQQMVYQRPGSPLPHSYFGYQIHGPLPDSVIVTPNSPPWRQDTAAEPKSSRVNLKRERSESEADSLPQALQNLFQIYDQTSIASLLPPFAAEVVSQKSLTRKLEGTIKGLRNELKHSLVKQTDAIEGLRGEMKDLLEKQTEVLLTMLEVMKDSNTKPEQNLTICIVTVHHFKLLHHSLAGDFADFSLPLFAASKSLNGLPTIRIHTTLFCFHSHEQQYVSVWGSLLRIASKKARVESNDDLVSASNVTNSINHEVAPCHSPTASSLGSSFKVSDTSLTLLAASETSHQSGTGYTGVGDLAEKRKTALQAEAEKKRHAREEAEKQLEQLGIVLERITKSELLIAGRRASIPRTPGRGQEATTDAMFGSSLTVAMVSRVQKGGETLTKVYADYAPILAQQCEDYECLQLEATQLSA
ncbi:hypothetical protein EDC04DRAFT_2611626 [Pisolithus marmoratus]|nr:hypothetical protein EDC04DRAFT_2611626 [Pisolithus marmoratus]